MARGKKTPELNLPTADELFTTQEERDDMRREKVVDIALAEIDAFPDHPFQVKQDESMHSMVDSVKAVGIQTPAVVRLKDDGRYEMVSGHRRKMACELAGLDVMPCIVRELSQDEAIIAMGAVCLWHTLCAWSASGTGGRESPEGSNTAERESEVLQDEAGGYEAATRRANRFNLCPSGAQDSELAFKGGFSRG